MATQQTSARLRPFGTTIFAEMTALARQHDAVNLSQGFPDEDGPQLLHEAAARALRDHDNQYAPLPGTPDLRAAISQQWGTQGNRQPDPDTEITVTAGCTEAIAATALGLLNPGDEVILFEPFYDSYRACIALADAKPTFVQIKRTTDPLTNTDRYTFDANHLAEVFTPNTRAILLNTPHNPTGSAFTRAELQLIADLCTKHDTVAISDEVYERLDFNPARPHISIASLPGMQDRTITLSSLGKTFSMTGWKIGWAIAPPHLTAAVRAAHQFLTFAVAKPLQHAAAAALTSPEAAAWVDSLRDTLKSRRDFFTTHLTSLGFDPVLPDAGYFVMAKHSAISERMGITNDADFVRRMTAEARVAAIPPSAFCVDPDLCRDAVRFAFCKNEQLLTEAVARLESWLSKP